MIENLKPVVTTTTGFLIHEESEYYVVAFSINENQAVGGNICILKKNVISYKEV